jgi:hypothetical protein
MSEREHVDGNRRPENPFVQQILFSAYEGQNLDDIPGATHWPEVVAIEAHAQWAELRAWVEQLQQRFSYLDHHVVPRCWWLHNEHVEALCALRDHERASFAAIAPATAPLDWIRALRDVTALLRVWTAELSCGAVHQDSPPHASPPTDDEWGIFVQADIEHRDEREVVRSNVDGSRQTPPSEPTGNGS